VHAGQLHLKLKKSKRGGGAENNQQKEANAQAKQQDRSNVVGVPATRVKKSNAHFSKVSAAVPRVFFFFAAAAVLLLVCRRCCGGRAGMGKTEKENEQIRGTDLCVCVSNATSIVPRSHPPVD
jgi:hypothetical protein